MWNPSCNRTLWKNDQNLARVSLRQVSFSRRISQFMPKRMGLPCLVKSALKRTSMQDFKYFSMMFYFIISTTYQKIGDLFCPVIFLDCRTVWVEKISFHCIVCVSKKNHVLNTKQVHFLTVQYPNTIDNFFITIKHIFVRSPWKSIKTYNAIM